MGDFTGFTFGGVHSSDLGIIRVSSGDRYDEELHPEAEDRTAEVPGLDGGYYFGSNYKPKTIELNFAFDSITETQLRRLRKVFDLKQTKELIFDERPYKKYIAKIESPIELSYVCFDEPKKTIGTARDGVRVASRTRTLVSTVTNASEGLVVSVNETTFQSFFPDNGDYVFTYVDSIWYYDDAELDLSNYGIAVVLPEEFEGNLTFTISNTTETELTYEQVTPYIRNYSKTERIYKGEGKISFICYFPFAKSVYKQLPTNEEESDWAISSGILTETDYAAFDKYNSGIIKIYNAGDLSTGFRLYLPSAVAANNVTLNYKEDGINTSASLVLKAMTMKGGAHSDIGVLVDTTNELIIGVSSLVITQEGNTIYTTSGNIYNEYINYGYFFRLKPNSAEDGTTIQIINGADGIQIFYDYLYF